jgi:hypothetical protein
VTGLPPSSAATLWSGNSAGAEKKAAIHESGIALKFRKEEVGRENGGKAEGSSERLKAL